MNPQKLFFLIIITPVILIFLIIYGLFSTWAFRRSHHPVPAALANGLALAWAMTATFPLIGR